MKNLVRSNEIQVKEGLSIEEAMKMGIVALSLVATSHAYGTIPLFQRFNPNDIQILDTGNYDRTEVPVVQNYLDSLINNGIICDTRRFVPLMAGSSDQRKGKGVFCDEQKFWPIVDWASCGAIKPQTMSKLTCQKIAKYLALMMSTCKRWNDVYGDDPDMPCPEIEDFVVLNDIEVPIEGFVDRTTPQDVVRDLVLAMDEEKNKISDGAMFLVIDDLKWTEKKRREFMKKHDSSTIRIALTKGCAHIILKSAIIHLMKKYNIKSSIVEDAWKDNVDILNAKVIMFKSVFKGWKEFDSWAQYCHEFHKRNHEVWICVQSHGHRWASLPYQQLQTLDATDEEIEKLAEISYDWLLSHCTVGEFGEIIGGNLGKIVDIYPALLNDPYVREALQRAWISKVKATYGGRILHISHNLMCSPDVVAIFEGIFGLPVVGVIPSGFVITNGFSAGKKLGCTRCPHLDHAWFVAWNMKIPEEWLGFFGTGTTIFYSCHDNVMLLHQMDFDGDKSNVTDNKLLIEIAERSQEKYGNVPLLYAAMDAGDAKSTCDDYEKELKVLFSNLNKAPIGMYAIALNKLWAFAKADYQKYRKEISCVTRKGNTCIDEAGHGKDASIGVAEDVIADQRKRKMSKPSFMRYSKGHISEDGMDIIPAKSLHQFYAMHTVERYSALQQLMLPKHISDVADFSNIGKFDHQILMKNSNLKDGRIAALAGIVSDNGGLFNELCHAARNEEAMIATSSSLAACKEFTDDNVLNMQLSVADYAMERGLTYDDAIDVITFFLFYKIKRTNNFISQLKRWYFLAFGDRVLQNVMTNLNTSAKSADYESDDDDDDSVEE